jgi:hypothetical protein
MPASLHRVSSTHLRRPRTGGSRTVSGKPRCR